jgi:glycine/D-amino acid oxidase-like deaminating enzyme
VELAYSEDMREKPEPKKRRGLRTGTLLAAAAVVILATGLWSLNAKLSRLGDDGKPVRPAVAKAENNPPALTAPVTPALGLEDSVFLTLTPPPVPADSPAE